MKSIYLAGPDVFYRDGAERLARKATLVKEAGFLPVYAGVMVYPHCEDSFDNGCAISAVNEICLRGSDMMIANLTPFRGVGADVGTVFELGFMAALNRPIFAYSEDPRDHLSRISDHYGSKLSKPLDGIVRGPDGLMVEDHAMIDNLMVDGAIEHRGGKIFVPVGDESLDPFLACLKELTCMSKSRKLGSDAGRGRIRRHRQ
jgi:nucleoside 2-deoxyribosyltransferase